MEFTTKSQFGFQGSGMQYMLSNRSLIYAVRISTPGLYLVSLHSTIMGYYHDELPIKFFFGHEIVKNFRSHGNKIVKEYKVISCPITVPIVPICGTIDSNRLVFLHAGYLLKVYVTHPHLLYFDQTWFSILGVAHM